VYLSWLKLGFTDAHHGQFAFLGGHGYLNSKDREWFHEYVQLFNLENPSQSFLFLYIKKKTNLSSATLS